MPNVGGIVPSGADMAGPRSSVTEHSCTNVHAVGHCDVIHAGFSTVFGGYSFVAFLIALYFFWETAPFHRTRKMESAYMVGALLLVPVTNMVAAWQKKSNCFYQTSSWELSEMWFRQVVTFVLIFQMQHFVWPQAHPTFFEMRPHCPRPDMEESRKKAGGLAREIEQHIEDILDESPVLLQAGWLPFALFGYYMAEQLLWCADSGAQISYYFNLASGMSVFVSVGWIIRRLRQIDPAIEVLSERIRWLVKKGDKDTLQFVLANTSVSTLLEVGGGHITRSLTEYALERNLLTVLSKAILVDGLQTRGNGIRFSPSSQEAVVRILKSCRGTDLTAIKNIMDSSGTYNNLFKLVYEDLQSAEAQKMLLGHLWQEGIALRKRLRRAVGIKILSDVDDTLYCSGGRYPAGCDKRFPRRAVYPGVLTLFRVLDNDDGEVTDDMRSATHLEGGFSCNLVFLSARPHVYKDVAESNSYRLFNSLVREERMHSQPTLIPGTLRAGLRACITEPFKKTQAWRRVGRNKQRVYLAFRKLYPEYDYVFCGDNGQGDLYAGQLMLSRQKQPRHHEAHQGLPGGFASDKSAASKKRVRSFVDIRRHYSGSDESDEDAELSSGSFDSFPETPQLVAVLIHEVMETTQALARQPPEQRDDGWREALASKGLLFHRTYVGAAVSLHRMRPDLVPAVAVRTVAEEAVRQYQAERRHSRDAHMEWNEAHEVLSEDIRSVNGLFHELGLARIQELVPPDDASSMSSDDDYLLREIIEEEEEEAGSHDMMSSETSDSESSREILPARAAATATATAAAARVSFNRHVSVATGKTKARTKRTRSKSAEFVGNVTSSRPRSRSSSNSQG